MGTRDRPLKCFEWVRKLGYAFSRKAAALGVVRAKCAESCVHHCEVVLCALVRNLGQSTVCTLERRRQEVGAPRRYHRLGGAFCAEPGERGLSLQVVMSQPGFCFPVREQRKKTSNDLRYSWLIKSTKLGHKNKCSPQATQPPEITLCMFFLITKTILQVKTIKVITQLLSL